MPRMFEGLVVEKFKAKLVNKMSKFQIAKTGHRAQEHLFVAKSIIALYTQLNISLFCQFIDIQKFFDKESLRDGMDIIQMSGITGKLYRLWYRLNSRTKIKVKTSVGFSDTAVTNENIGQGTIGGAIVSAASLDDKIQSWFNASEDEVYYGSIHLQPLIYQDDIFRMRKTRNSAQIG